MANSLVPIYILNLDSSPERYEAVSTELNALNLVGDRVSGIDGSKLSSEQQNIYSPELNSKFFRHSLSNGEIGCYLGHRKIWQLMVDNNIDRAIILEDDVVFHPHFPHVIQAFSTLKDIELVKFHSAEGDISYQQRPLENDLLHVNYKRIPNCAAAYGLTLSGAKKLLARTKIYRPVDWDMQFCREFNISITGIQPYSVDQREDVKSDIATVNKGAHGHKAKYFWRNIRYRASVFWHRTVHVSGSINP